MLIIAPIPRDERRLMQKAIHKTRDKNHGRTDTAPGQQCQQCCPNALLRPFICWALD